MKQKQSYEASIGRLQEIIARLEQPDIPLEQSMKLFEEGVGLVKECGDFLAAAQQKVDVLSGTMNKILDEVE